MVAADAAASTGKYSRHPCNPRSDCKCWKPDGAWERSEKGDAADTAAATTLTTRPAGEHGKVIAEGQHKQSIMFLAERFQIFQAQNANACRTTDSARGLPPYRPRTKRPGRAALSSSS